jgi:diguanylate cyclase (GGDEF)-like protein
MVHGLGMITISQEVAMVNNDRKLEDTGDMGLDATIMGDSLTPPQLAETIEATLIVIAGGDIGSSIEVHGRGQIFGRSPLANNTFLSPSVSRQHMRIDKVEGDGPCYFRLTDLHSSNGTLVNGVRVEEARLKDGDKVTMGEILFKFILQDEAEHAFHQQIQRLIHYDRLTGLLTMESFRLRLEEHMRSKETNERFVLAMTDLDGLKRVNDTHGHLAGRMIIREMGVIMRQALRKDDIAGLYGGDEAIVIYPTCSLAEAHEIAEHLRAAIERRVFEMDGRHFQVTISQGLAEFPRHGIEVRQLIAAADRALYAAKAAGRNCIRHAE